MTPTYFRQGAKTMEASFTDIESDKTLLRLCFEPENIASVTSGFSFNLLLITRRRMSAMQDRTKDCAGTKKSG